MIVCSPVPLWQLRQKREKEYFALRATLNQLILQRGARIPLFLSGDSHFFAHYRRVDGAADEHHVTAGGGGAFMQPTHNLPEQVPYERGAPDFKLDARWPRPVESRSLATDLGNMRDPQFRWLFAIIAVVHAAFAGLVTIRTGALQHVDSPLDGPDTAARWVVAAWPGWPILALLLIAMTVATAPNSRESHLVKGSKRYGLMHGVAQAVLFVAVAAFAAGGSGPTRGGGDSCWCRSSAVWLSTVLFVMAVRWINRSIKAERHARLLARRTSPATSTSSGCGSGPVATSHLFVDRHRPGGRGLVRPHDHVRCVGAAVRPQRRRTEAALRVGPLVRQRQRTSRWWIATAPSGNDHPDTLYALASFGRRELAAGSLPSAIGALSNAVEAAEIVHGVNHHTTLAYRDSLADALAEAGDFESAIALLQAAVDARTAQDMAATEKSQSTPGPRRVTVDSLVRLGHAYTAAGRPYEAASRFEGSTGSAALARGTAAHAPTRRSCSATSRSH